jgi:hypothetical protein
MEVQKRGLPCFIIMLSSPMARLGHIWILEKKVVLQIGSSAAKSVSSTTYFN